MADIPWRGSGRPRRVSSNTQTGEIDTPEGGPLSRRVARTLGCVIALSVVWSSSGASAQTLFSPTQDPLAGSRVFGAKGCVKCHAVNGVGGKVAPDLGRVLRPHSFFDLAAALWNHAPRMAERMRQLGIVRPELDPQETGDLVAFLFTLDYFDPPGNADSGRRLFTEKRCVVCHQVGGTGGVVGPSLDGLKQYGSPIFLATAMWNHGPQMADAMRAKGIPRPTFKDSDLRDLIAYVNAASPVLPQGPLYVLPGRATRGRLLFAQKRCIECHAAGDRGGAVGPNLAERGLHRSLSDFAASMWNKAPGMLEAMKARAVQVPQLKPDEMADIVAYLYSVRYFAGGGDPRKGMLIAAEKGCLGCHGLRGERGKTAADLAQVRGLDSPVSVLSALWNHAFLREPDAGRGKSRWSEIRPDEMADLAAFLQSLRPQR